MIARHEATVEKMDIWAQLSAPLPTGVIAWRQDGRAIQRDGKYFARFVAYVDANTVRERLDSVVAGEWDLTLELLPTLPSDEQDEATCSFKARLQILGVIREDVGTGRDYKSAATDAFKRAAVRFGIAHELYAYEQNWVQVDGEGRYAKALEDPAEAYARRTSRGARSELPIPRASDLADVAEELPVATGPLASDEPTCPKCGGRMWDNRLSKRNPKAPDFKCRNRSCDGVIWPPRVGSAATKAEPTEQPDDANEIPF
jgi:hypothetical protein